MHWNVIFVHAETLEETKYKLKTSMGVSHEYSTPAFPIFTVLDRAAGICPLFDASLVWFSLCAMKTKHMVLTPALLTDKCLSPFPWWDSLTTALDR
jgi:hypothetical protein